MSKYENVLDEELVLNYANGDNDAFDELLNRHKQSVFNYILFIVRNRDLAEDIFQETFIKVIITIKQGKYKESGKLRAWMCRIAHNLIIDHFRQERNKKTVSNEDYEMDLFNDISLAEDTVETSIIKTQILDDVKSLVDFLPENQREVLKMRYYQDMSFKEISDQTGVSINTALGRMRYAIINIRKMVEENNLELTL